MIDIKIKTTSTIQLIDFIGAYSEEKQVEWNDACDLTGDYDLKGLFDMELIDDLLEDDAEYSEGYKFLKQIMEERNLKEVRIV